jgi:hypothetical protein
MDAGTLMVARLSSQGCQKDHPARKSGPEGARFSRWLQSIRTSPYQPLLIIIIIFFTLTLAFGILKPLDEL